MGALPGPRRGVDLGDLHPIDACDVVVDPPTIAAVGPGVGDPVPGDVVIEGNGRVLMPGFIDTHTHACWGGGDDHRLDEWERKLAGATYLEILAAGGGIMATVRATRKASEHDLADSLLRRLGRMLRGGTTTLEVKSGYGLSTPDELKMLRAICRAGQRWPGSIVPTALLGHAIDPDQDNFVDRTIGQTLPAVAEAFPGITIDAYCEDGAWSLADCLGLFDAAQARGHRIRVHADQFNSLGMVAAGIERGYRSVDHLEASSPADLARLGGSATFGVVLPCSGFHVDGRYADARAIVDSGGAICLATNGNPGSAPTGSMPMAIALGVRFCGLSPSEAIAACTVNAAALLGLDDRGRIQPGLRADLVLLGHTDERRLAYEFGSDPVECVLCGGRIVRSDGGPG